MLPKSIRWRMQLWQAFLLVCVLSGFGVTAYQLHRTNLIGRIDKDLALRVAALSADVRMPPFGPRGRPPFEPWMGTGTNRGSPGPLPPRPGPDFRGPRGHPDDPPGQREIRPSQRTLDLFEPVEFKDFYYVVWSRGGNPLKRSTNAPVAIAIPTRSDAVMTIQARTRATSREVFQFTEIGECVLVGRSIVMDLAALRRFALWLVAAGTGVLALGLGGGWLLATRALRPVENIGAAAGRISAGNLAERIDIADTDSELGRLAGVLNSTFARLEASFAQQRQFTADASHELRTPLAVLISEAQATLARERTAAEYRETVEACLETAQQMKRLTQSLLALARYDAGQETIERLPVDLAEQTRACVDLAKPLARERGIEIRCDLEPAETLGDADRLSLVIANLLSNAVEYNKNGGQVRVATRVESGHAVLIVADTGQGISNDDLPRIFERFYRADKSRASGHWGLGLAISKAIVDAHGGSIAVSSQPGAGAVFTLRLPLSPRP